MKSFGFALFLATLLSACAGSGVTSPAVNAAHGAVTIEIVPNPIIATNVRDDVYRFPFDLHVREVGGRPVSITAISASVYAFGGLRVYNERYDASQIQGLGFSSSLPAEGQASYHFAPQKSVADERLFSGVTAELTVEAVDDAGFASSAHTTVTVQR